MRIFFFTESGLGVARLLVTQAIFINRTNPDIICGISSMEQDAGLIQELKNTVYVSPNDYEKLKKLLMEAYEIIVNNIKKKPVNLKGNTAINKRLVARELLLTAKELLADTKSDYVYDPDHKNKPKGGGWEKRRRGELKRKKIEILWGGQKKQSTDSRTLPQIQKQILKN